MAKHGIDVKTSKKRVKRVIYETAKSRGRSISKEEDEDTENLSGYEEIMPLKKVVPKKRAVRRLLRGHPQQCVVCQKEFQSVSLLKKHIMICHEEGSRYHKCDLCQKRFAEDAHLTDHMYLHSEEYTFKCGFCDKVYRLERQLVHHQQRHLCDKPDFLTEGEMNDNGMEYGEITEDLPQTIGKSEGNEEEQDKEQNNVPKSTAKALTCVLCQVTFKVGVCNYQMGIDLYTCEFYLNRVTNW